MGKLTGLGERLDGTIGEVCADVNSSWMFWVITQLFLRTQENQCRDENHVVLEFSLRDL